METLAQREVTVTFDASANRVVFGGTGYDSANGQIDISSSDLGLITFQLDNSGVFFPSNPVQWVDDKFQPIDPPAGATVMRRNNLAFTILVVRSQVPAAQLQFYVVVYFLGVRGRFFGTDPTIVTMSSSGGQSTGSRS
jgi:hypothetical protein